MKIIKLLPSLALVTAVIVASCGKLEDRINSLEQRISELEDTRIPSIDEQVASIKKTIGELEKTDAGLREYISALEDKQAKLETELGKTNAALAEAQKTLREEMAADKSELSGEVDAAKADVIAQLEAYKTIMNGELETLNSTIEALKAKDEELQKNAEELRSYVDSENGKVRDWADATFATIEQQNRLAETVAGIKTQLETLNTYTMNMDVRLTNKDEELSKSLSALDESTRQQIGALTDKLGSDISALRTELTDAYTKLVATELAKLETSMKSWVNEQLAGYYTVEQTDAKLDAMRTELVGRMDSDKAYLTTLITNLETATNKKISANTSLITGLRGDLTSLSQSVAENAGKIADDAILISQNTSAISKNGAAIAANTKDLAAVKKLAEENQKLIAENSEKLSEMQRLHAALKDSGVEDCVETVIQNTKDIASNASLIAKNAEAIRSNAAAIAQNTSDIQALSARLDATKAEIVEAYTAAIAKAISDYDGTITAKLASEIAKVEEKIVGLKTEVESVKSRVNALEDRVARLEEIVSQITSISYIPRYSDGVERVEYARDVLDIIPGDITLRFDVHPASAASEIAANWESVLSSRAVYSRTGDFVEMKIKGATAENGVLYVKVSAEGLNKDFILGNKSVAISIKVTTASGPVAVSDYMSLVSNIYFNGEYEFIKYLLNSFDTDEDGTVDLSAVRECKEFKIADMSVSSIDKVLKEMPNLEKLTISNIPECKNLNISTNTKLQALTIEGLDIAELNIVSNTELSSLHINGNSKLRYLILSDRKALENIFNFNCDADLNFIDEDNNTIYGKIAGQLWFPTNIGASTSNLYGELIMFQKAKASCPSGWRLPTSSEFEALKANYSDWTTYNGINGRWFSGANKFNSNALSVFFPAAGYAYTTAIEPQHRDLEGKYWTSDVSYGINDRVSILYFNSNSVKIDETAGYEVEDFTHLQSIRCVKDE